jgi:hypothetical protein
MMINASNSCNFECKRYQFSKIINKIDNNVDLYIAPSHEYPTNIIFLAANWNFFN